MAALRHSPVLGPVPGGGRVVGTLVARNALPLCHVSRRKSRSSYSYLSSKLLTPASAGLPQLHKGARGFVVRRRPQLPPLLCFFGIGGAGSGSRRDDSTGVEDEDADIEELVIRSRGKLVIDVHPLQEARREEEEAVRKGREMLFEQFRLHLGVTPQELRAIWWARGGGSAEERLRLVRDFLEGEWGWRYRPLSPRAAVEMLDEHMGMGSLEGRAASAAAVAHRRRLLPNWWR
ncbi:hypothetical protein Taro_028414 [Colocasia esculenta]|uniref:DUF7026 domain-containing protein n=1 Tax=Colocasia esculenta TaxID=4460 RepID=A0A843VH78_COLES|nr:hypothetical protein [Colocasia esculenta]